MDRMTESGSVNVNGIARVFRIFTYLNISRIGLRWVASIGLTCSAKMDVVAILHQTEGRILPCHKITHFPQLLSLFLAIAKNAYRARKK